MTARRIFATVLLFVPLLGCGPSEANRQAVAPTGSAGKAKTIQINGAGATFPNPIYSKWFDQYGKAHPGVRINYQPIGSGGGIKQLSAGTVFFGATDGPMTDDQMKAAAGPVLHFPTVAGAVVPIYNIPGITLPLRFSGAQLADLYLGKITKWNDARMVKANPGAILPDLPVTIVHRSDGSGTTFIFCDFLSKVSASFRSTVGANTSVSWPVGVGAKGNEGVTSLVHQTPGALGYVELIYAEQTGVPHGSVQNAAGNFIAASVESVTAAAATASVPDDFRVSITNAPGKDAYPISSFTWLLFSQKPEDKARARIMVDFLRWALTDGQHQAAELHYAPIPRTLVDRELAALGKIQTQ